MSHKIENNPHNPVEKVPVPEFNNQEEDPTTNVAQTALENLVTQQEDNTTNAPKTLEIKAKITKLKSSCEKERLEALIFVQKYGAHIENLKDESKQLDALIFLNTHTQDIIDIKDIRLIFPQLFKIIKGKCKEEKEIAVSLFLKMEIDMKSNNNLREYYFFLLTRIIRHCQIEQATNALEKLKDLDPLSKSCSNLNIAAQIKHFGRKLPRSRFNFLAVHTKCAVLPSRS